MRHRTHLMIILVGAGCIAAVEWAFSVALESEKVSYQIASAEKTARVADLYEITFDEIYRDIRTIARLPSIRTMTTKSAAMDRGGNTLDSDDRLVIQELYNSLASNIDASELYIVPLDLDPEGSDPTGKAPREPLVTFDELIVGRVGGSDTDTRQSMEIEEIEIYEYRQMRAQLDWMLEHFPHASLIDQLKYPMLSSPPVVTCDNSRYDPTSPDDHDREGIVFSVPIYNMTGELSGCVSTVLLSHTLGDLLPSADYALLNSQIDYVASKHQQGQWYRSHTQDSARATKDVTPDDRLIYSEVIPIPTVNPSTQWSVWAGHSNKLFWNLNGVVAINNARKMSLSGVILVILGALVAASLLQRAQRRLAALNDGLERAIAQRTAELQLIAETDKLTGLPNRSVLQRRLTHTLARCKRSGRYCAVLFFDFDRFKVINDSLGHDMGDALLISIAELFRKNLRSVDTPSRFGGDEFVVILDELAAPSDAYFVAEKLLQVFAEPHDLSGQRVVSTASIGVVTSEHQHASGMDMIRDADSAMYQAKALGKNRVVAFDRSMHEEAMERLQLEELLRIAIEANQFFLEFQPIVQISSGKIVAAEALIRWECPSRGLIGPAQFIPLAEDTGLIIPIGKWVIEQACTQLHDWQQRNILSTEFALSINVSKRQLLDQHFERDLLAALDQRHLPTTLLKLEVTESTVIDNRGGITSVLERIRSHGFKIMMDDFGTGHSSLSGLHLLPIDAIKIDQSFIRQSNQNRRLIAITSSIIDLAGHLNLRTIGEGIESLEHLTFLQSLGCNCGQGFFFSKPVAAPIFESLLRSPDHFQRVAS
jgi:diguanylate cyclase (GGDEF)-like protein